MNQRSPLTIAFIQEKLAGYRRRAIEKSPFTRSAVLMPIVQRDNGLDLLFTKRSDAVEHHKGQISFPGGAADPADTSASDTALRESFEEIGLPPSAVKIIGTVDDLQTPSRFVVTPIVGAVEYLPPLHINRDEVAQVILIPLEKFFDESLRRSEFRERDGVKVEVFSYDVWEEPVWGATAFFVKQLVGLLKGG
ncbi:MAG TPA: CoA pyrophosphatase [Bacteroidota bacterium]|nr:CoA pyrophosphatase [Bacteroidota bacterium]